MRYRVVLFCFVLFCFVLYCFVVFQRDCHPPFINIIINRDLGKSERRSGGGEGGEVNGRKDTEKKYE